MDLYFLDTLKTFYTPQQCHPTGCFMQNVTIGLLIAKLLNSSLIAYILPESIVF